MTLHSASLIQLRQILLLLSCEFLPPHTNPLINPANTTRAKDRGRYPLANPRMRYMAHLESFVSIDPHKQK